MLKRIVLFLSILCAGLILNSCSESLEHTSSVSFKLSDSFFREALSSNSGSISASDAAVKDDSNASKEYKVKVSVNWEERNRFDEKTITPDSEGKFNCPEFTFEELLAGKTVTIDVSISCGGTVIYKMKDPIQKKLASGKNECSVELEKQVADINVSITNKDFLKLDSDSSYKIVFEITESSGKTEKGEYVFNSESYKIAENKTIGETLKINVSVYKENLCLYKTLEPVSVTVDKENNISVTLDNAVSTTAVWQNKRSPVDGPWPLSQKKSYNVEKEEDSLAVYCMMYTFATDGRLVALESRDSTETELNFNVYELNPATLIYDTEPSNSFKITCDGDFSIADIADIYCDSGYLYILTYDVFVTKYDIANDKSHKISINSGDVLEYACKALAVKGDNIFVSSIVSDGADGSEPVILFGNLKDTETTSVKFTKFEFDLPIPTDKEANLSITDLQFGDGLGNDADKLYALVRNCNDPNRPNDITDDTVVYEHSSGALVEIDVKSMTCRTFGYDVELKPEVIEVDGVTCYFVSPGATDISSSYFYGPYKFAALAPRKLIILDDGICVKDYDGNNKFSNNDALYEFDIATSALKRGAEVDSSVPNASGFTKDW